MLFPHLLAIINDYASQFKKLLQQEGYATQSTCSFEWSTLYCDIMSNCYHHGNMTFDIAKDPLFAKSVTLEIFMKEHISMIQPLLYFPNRGRSVRLEM